MKRLANVSKTMITPLIFATFIFRFILITIVPKIRFLLQMNQKLLFCFSVFGQKESLETVCFQGFFLWWALQGSNL